MKIRLTDVYTGIHYYLTSAFFGALFTSVHNYIYSGGATYWHISRLLIVYHLHYGGCASCTYLDIILYSQQLLPSILLEITGICDMT